MCDRIFIDTETTGLKPEQGAVALSLAAIAGDSTFSVMVMPTPDEWAAATPEALAVNGITWEQLEQDALPMGDALDLFNKWLVEQGVDEHTVWVGQNPKFDHGFVADWFDKCPATYLDIRDMYTALQRANKVPYIQKRSGRWIAISLGVDPEPDVHLALEGAKVVKRNYDALIAKGSKVEPMRWPDLVLQRSMF